VHKRLKKLLDGLNWKRQQGGRRAGTKKGSSNESLRGRERDIKKEKKKMWGVRYKPETEKGERAALRGGPVCKWGVFEKRKKKLPTKKLRRGWNYCSKKS